jgi:CheY-like chemotaxis protein
MIKLHVLFADDEPDIRAIIEAALARDPLFVPRGCASGEEAVATATDWRPDLALLDIAMPPLDGPEVAARLRADRHTALIPVVFVTGNVGAPQRFKDLGAIGVIAKPFDPLRLAAEVRRFVPVVGALAPARDSFMERLAADARVLAACRRALARRRSTAALLRIRALAHALAGAGGIYGFAGISCEAAALADVAAQRLARRAGQADIEHALDRLQSRIRPALVACGPCGERQIPIEGRRYSAATAWTGSSASTAGSCLPPNSQVCNRSR